MQISEETSIEPGHRAGFDVAGILGKPACESALILVTNDFVISGANRQAAELLGQKVEDLLARRLEVFSGDLCRLLKRSPEFEESLGDNRVAVSLPGGETLMAAAKICVLQSADAGNSWVILLQDAAATPPDIRLLQLDRLAKLGTLAASTAHEIKNSLVAGKTFIDLLLEKNPTSDLVQVVERELRRTDMLLAQVLRFASPAAAGASTAVSVHAVLEHAMRLVQHEFTSKGIVVEQGLSASVDRVCAGEYQLEQVFMNLLLNALEATGPGGTLKISSENRAPDQTRFTRPGEPTPYVALSVADNGMGMSAEVMRHLFEPFFSTKENGTGLGLTITRQIVTEIGGSIEVDTKPGRGTTFTVFLPVKAASQNGI